MSLKLIPCGLDFGNGWIKISIDNKASKIPNWITAQKPEGKLSAKMKMIKPMAFPLKVKDEIFWFGQDTLSLAGKQKLDGLKYKPDYIRTLFKAILWHWLNQHNIDPDWLKDKRLKVVCGMPPKQFQGKLRGKAEKVYKFVFKQNKPDYINLPDDEPAIPFFTDFGSVKPETLIWQLVNTLKPTFTLLVDLGYGTSDFCLLKKGLDNPVVTKTLPNGLFTNHHDTNPNKPYQAELAVMRGEIPNAYSDIVEQKILSIVRDVKITQLVIFGGGSNLLSQETLKDIGTYVSVLNVGRGYDEFSNARWFEKLAKRGVENGL